MLIYPAVDLFGGRAVRLKRGDYSEMTVYGEAESFAAGFAADGAEWIHIVDLEGARSGGTPNIDTVRRIINTSGLRAEVGGGIRSPGTVKAYLDSGASRVILGTAAAEDPEFLRQMTAEYGEKIAVGADLADGYVAVRGWTERTGYTAEEFCEKIAAAGVKTLICTDISRDGMLKGANIGLYEELSRKFPLEFIASGGVSAIDDIIKLRELGLAGAIVGKALYEGALDLKRCIEAAR